MGMVWRLPLVAVVLLIAGSVSAQQAAQGWLGAELQDVTKEEADKLGWDAPRGAKVTAASPGSPADKAGVKAGDIVVAVERTQIDTASELNAAIAARGPGAQVLLSVLSGGRERRVTATLAERPKAQAADAGTGLHLMLDTGGHRGIIAGLAFTPDGRQIVSAGRDKVVRVWDWKSGKTVRTIRGQVGPDPWNDGTIYAMALSPDGHSLAVGGRMAEGTESNPPMARVHDFATGRLLTLLRGDRHGAQVRRLAFSPDGKRLISQEFGGAASVWDVASGKLLHRLGQHDQVIIDAVGFTRDGRAVTGASDTTVRLWLPTDGREDFRLAGHKDRVSALAVSPMDGTVVSGDWSGEIRRRESETGNPVRMLARQRAPVEALHISPNGRWLLSADQFGDWVFGARVWELATGREVQAYAGHDNTVFSAAISADSRYAATAGGSRFAIHVWELETGARSTSQDGKPLALEGTGAPPWAVGFSEDGQSIAWGRASTKENQTPLEFRLRLPAAGRSLGAPEPLRGEADAGFLRARTSHGAYTIARRTVGGGANPYGVLEVKKDGQVAASIELARGEGSRQGVDTFTPDGQTIVVGNLGGWMVPHTPEGKRAAGMFLGHEGQILSVAASAGGRLLASGSADQTVRLWNLETRELIVSLFHGRDGEWVMWTPQGYYTGSPGADKIVGWQINRGPDRAADYVGAEQLRQHLNRPDIVERAIVLASAEAAIREAPGTSFKLADLLARPVPRFKVVSPAGGSAQGGGRATVGIDIEPIPDPVKLIRVHVNGRQVEEQTPDIGSGGFGSGERLLHVPLARGRNDVRIALTNAIGEKAETLTLTHDGEGGLDQRGTLHILAIGVNDYKGLGDACGGSCDLRYAVADARKLAEAVEKQLGPGHARVVKRVLVNGGNAKDAPTAGNIIDAVELLRQARETDTVVLFISGHGKNEGPDYRFLPTDAELTGGTLRGSTVVPWQVLQSAVEAAKGRRILLVDTCHSGNAYNQRLGNAAYHANIIAYAASRFDQEAIEDPALGHGLFTYAMVEGLNGKGDLGAKREISTKDLAAYVTARVTELAKSLRGEQEPQYFKGRDADDYVLARR